jgi:hypothetical protein
MLPEAVFTVKRNSPVVRDLHPTRRCLVSANGDAMIGKERAIAREVGGSGWVAEARGLLHGEVDESNQYVAAATKLRVRGCE